MFAASSSNSTSSTKSAPDSSSWANRIFAFFNFLFIKPEHFTDLLSEFAVFMDASIGLKFTPSFSPKQTFSTVPIVLLQAHIPSTGFIVTFRAILDSGASSSIVSSKLATVLIDNGATCQYIWPNVHSLVFWKVHPLLYRKISRLTLQSVENNSRTIVTSIKIEECISHFVDWLPVDLVVEKMASLGLPMVQSGKLGRTTWSPEDPKYVNFIRIISFLVYIFILQLTVSS